MFLIVGVSLFLMLGSLAPRKKQAALLFFSFSLLFFLSAFRDVTVGTDTLHYEQYFFEISSGTEWLRLAIEPAWVLLNDFVIYFDGSFRHVIVFSTLLTLLPVYYVASRHSKNPMFTVFLYCTLYFYWYSFNITRQSIAFGLILVSMIFILNRRYVYFCLFVFFASLFHYSAIVAFILLAVEKIPERRFYLIFSVFVAMVLGTVGVDYLYSLVGLTKYGHYLLKYEVGNFIGNFLYLMILNSFFVLVIFSIKSLSTEVKIFFMFVIIQNLLVRIPIGNRIVLYFSIVQVIFLPYFIKNIRSRDQGIVMIMVSLVLAFSFVILYHNFGAGQILPYKNILL